MLARMLTAVVLSLAIAGTAAAADPETRTVAKDEATEAKPAREAPFFLFADTQVSYRYQMDAVAPGVQTRQADGSVRTRVFPKQILNIAHADAWAYGTNFFSLDILKSGSQAPAGTTNPPGSIAAPFFEDYGNTEAYGLYRGTLSLNAITSSKGFALPGVVKDVSLAFGFDANSQNDAFGSKKRDIVGGLNVSFDVPVGFLNLSAHAYKEWNRNGFNVRPDRDQNFDTVPEFEIVYNFPLTFFPNLPLSIAGFNNIVLPKGRGIARGNLADYAFNPPRQLEFLSRTNLVLDLGKLIWNQPNRLDAFVGFQYWLNKFGNGETATFKGTEEKSVLAGIAGHVF